MALPTSRDITINPSDPIPGSIINKLEDCVVGAKRPSLWKWRMPLGRASLETNLTWDYINAKATANPGPGFGTLIELDPFVGDRITTIGARVLGTGAGGNVVVTLYRNNGDGTARTVIQTLTIVTPPAAWADYTQALAVPEVVADQKSYFLEIELPTTNQAIAAVGYASDRL